jgi:hypothetical protein
VFLKRILWLHRKGVNQFGQGAVFESRNKPTFTFDIPIHVVGDPSRLVVESSDESKRLGAISRENAIPQYAIWNSAVSRPTAV